jgi:hypothetical protein
MNWDESMSVTASLMCEYKNGHLVLTLAVHNDKYHALIEKFMDDLAKHGIKPPVKIVMEEEQAGRKRVKKPKEVEGEDWDFFTITPKYDLPNDVGEKC